jgi:hypothetical protein
MAMSAALTLVAVCGAAGCATHADGVVAALRPVVRGAPDGVLLRTSACPSVAACARGCGARVVVQRCTPALRPLGPSTGLHVTDAAAGARTVAAWLRGHRIMRRRP